MGSGSLNAMAMFEANYRDNMEKAEAMDLVSRAIQFGMSLIMWHGLHERTCSCRIDASQYRHAKYQLHTLIIRTLILPWDKNCNFMLSAGIYNDLGSGSNVDLCVITKDGVEYKRNIEFLQGKLFDRQFPKDFKENPVTVVKQNQMLSLQDVEVIEGEPEAMDTS